jgi:lipopolysaccharide export system protein LptA
VIKELPKDSVIIINGDSIKIIKKDSYIAIDGNLKIEVKGDITIKGNKFVILPKGTNEDNVENLLSYSKLKNVLETSLGNFGSPIQFPLTLEEEILTYPNIQIGK